MAFFFETYTKISIMKSKVPALLACVIMLSSCGRGETDSQKLAKDLNEAKFDSSGIKKDTEFAVDVADGCMLEVKLGELAQSQGNSFKVRELGLLMAQEQTKVNSQLRLLASQKNISLPVDLSDKSQRKYDDLAKKNGADFDKAFTKTMVKRHRDVIALFQRESETGGDNNLREWASGKLPELQHHLSMAEKIESEMD
jgi:putative membrane protein